ncbi:hypothetical protein ACH5RR_023021 [Cinchona calisaya]|uniref:Chaperone DnaJ C-terminal domain-containing protein n=1 Tax=Cinchona calisaya TaxID=153742 RepID=A0ABD2Z9H1_9GENT
MNDPEVGARHPDTVTRDIVFVLQQRKEHPKFKRKFDDLYVEHSLNLTEALCGFPFILTHLDGRKLLVKSDPGEVFKPESGILSPEQCQMLKTKLPSGSLEQLSDMELNECEETTLHDINIDEEMRQKHRHKQQEAYDEDEDEDDDPTMHRMACNQQ